jgi:LPS sulfotransferase NodH
VLAQAIERASSANGVYGFKVFSNHFDLAEKTSWAERLPRLRFVHIERRDLLGQAISHVRAVQTDQFESRASAGREARYDARAIASALDRIGRNQARWRIWFARNGIEPLRLTYEDIVADPHAAVEAVARLVAVAGYSRAELANTDLQVQRDALSQGWRSRFLVERRDLTRLDSGFSRLGVQLRRWRSTLSLTRHGGKIRPHPGTHEAQGEAKGH